MTETNASNVPSDTILKTISAAQFLLNVSLMILILEHAFLAIQDINLFQDSASQKDKEFTLQAINVSLVFLIIVWLMDSVFTNLLK